jgi:TFIIH basal transcription factor complex TTD-A subunit
MKFVLQSLFISDMVNVVKGSLIKCDPAIKQYLVHLDETLAFGEKFILHNLDEQHLFVQTSAVPMIKEKLQEQIDKISYDSTQTK